MEVIGKTIKSFNVSPLTGKTIEVTNYPFRRRSEEEISFAFKIKTLRKTEIEVAKVPLPLFNIDLTFKLLNF